MLALVWAIWCRHVLTPDQFQPKTKLHTTIYQVCECSTFPTFSLILPSTVVSTEYSVLLTDFGIFLLF